MVRGLPLWFRGKESRGNTGTAGDSDSLGWEDALNEGLATLSSILAWEIPWTEDTGGLQYMGCKRVGHNLATKTTNSNKRG